MLTIKNPAAKILIFFLAAVTLFTGCAPPGPRALLQGKKLLERGKYDEAVEELKTAAVLLGGTNAQAYNYLGVACQHAGQAREAERAYQKALALSPDFAEVRFNLGCLALDEGRFEQARSELTDYTLRRPNSADGWLKLGLAQLRQAQSAAAHARSGQLAVAEKSFNEGLRLSPQNAEALTGLGLVAVQRGQPGDAKQFFNRAWKAQPDYRPALLNLAIVEQQYLGERQAALENYRQYLALKPAPEDSEAVRAVAQQLERDLAPTPPSAATATFPQVRTNAPPPRVAPPESAHASTLAKIPAPDTNRTAVRPRTGSSQETNRAVFATRAEPLPLTPKPAPSTIAARTTTAQTTIPAQEMENVRLPPEPVLKTAQDGASQTVAPPPAALPQDSPAAPPPLPADPRFPRYHYRAPVKPTPGDRSAAERAFAQGVQAHQAQHLQEAIASYRRALQLDPAFFDASYNLGLAATLAGNLPLALSSYENALAIRPNSDDARYNFALLLKQANYLPDAANELEKVVAEYPNDSRAHLALGNLYAQQLQQPAKAREHYVKVLEIDPRNPQAAAIGSWLTDPGR